MTDLQRHVQQQQFLEVMDRDQAAGRLQAALDLRPCGEQRVGLTEALGRILARDITAPVDVPAFDRSNVDGFAVRAEDTFGATEYHPRVLALADELVHPGSPPTEQVHPGRAVAIATGGMLPRGADAVVMVEHVDVQQSRLQVFKPVAAGQGLTFAGNDIAAGELILTAGQRLTSRETGVLAAMGMPDIYVRRRPLVAILSTGSEIIPPGSPMQPAKVFDSNARILADAVRELGGEPWNLGILPDDLARLEEAVKQALERADLVLLSGGTSKGAGDLSYQVVRRLNDPGVVAHGVALKPGKPLCLAATGGKAVVVLPGFPTSAIFTFHEFVAPILRQLAGQPDDPRPRLAARMAHKVHSEVGRTEYLLVRLIDDAPAGHAQRLTAYPMGKGSGSVTTFSYADGFVSIDRHTELLEAGQTVTVQLLGRDLQLADLVVMGSHCVGLDLMLSLLHQQGLRTKMMTIGSTAGLAAAQRGHCDVAGIHLLDPKTGQYNLPLMTDTVQLVRGYARRQGLVFRPDDSRLAGLDQDALLERIRKSDELLMINRNQGSGTRILIDQILGPYRPAGYSHQARSHNAVAAAVTQGRADWGVAIETAAQRNGLAFVHLADEQFDFAIPRSRWSRPPVQQFCTLLEEAGTRARLADLGLVAAGVPRSGTPHGQILTG